MEIKIGKPKSASSKRTVPLNATSIAMIEDLRREEAFFGENTPLVCYENCGYTKPMYFRKRYYRILKAAGIERKGLHSLRHTFATKGDFVRQAIKLYMAYLRQNKSLDFLSPLLAQTIRGEIESVEKNICGMLFKVAVEQAINSNIVAAENDIDAESLDQLRDSCARMVAENNGLITFEDAYDWQRGE